MNGRPRVVGIRGSHREESTSRTALVHALAAAEAEGAETELLDLREFDLPPYGGANRDAGDARIGRLPELLDGERVEAESVADD